MKARNPFLVAAALPLLAAADPFYITGGAGSYAVPDGDDCVITVTQSGTLHVTGSGTIDVLLVGGGGGSGAPFDNSTDLFGSGGGGGGGVVYQTGVAVMEGDYVITVGAGGAGGGEINSKKGTGGPAASGGDTVAFGITAYGGGAGAYHYGGNGTNGGTGGSGGGAVSTYNTANRTGGAAKDDGAQGNKGGDSPAAFCPGGGGGAGGEGGTHAWKTDWANYGGGDGGAGRAIAITGSEVYYGGGGAGYAPKNTPRTSAVDPNNGAGGAGGGASGLLGKGEDGLGGGGSGGGDGGSGVVIVRYTPSGVESVANTPDFAISGGDSSAPLADGTVLTFTRDGTLTVSGSGILDVLVVGGGGGSGAPFDNSTDLFGSGGGGGGGVVYATNLVVSPGSYAISVGSGGTGGGEMKSNRGTGGPATNGGNSSVFGIVAYGGGAGGYHYGSGSSAGSDGATSGGAVALYTGSRTALAPLLDGAQGNKGGDSNAAFCPGGGGGAGGAGGGRGFAAWSSYGGGNGGAGVTNAITGTEVCYGGGGAGYAPVNTPRTNAAPNNGAGGAGGGASGLLGKGEDGLGGGGSGGGDGGSGVVIVRLRKTTGNEVLSELAEGGERIPVGSGYRAHKFTVDGTFTMPQDGLVDVLLVGGGGGSGTFTGESGYGCGGGGGGGVVYKTSMFLAAGEHPVRIGTGGAGGYDAANSGEINGGIASNGGDTVAFGITAYGGGAGAHRLGSGNKRQGSAGASGGGSITQWDSSSAPIAGGEAIYGDQGNPGGACSYAPCPGGGGGAGDNAVGGTHAWTYFSRYGGGNGGDGRAVSITGSEVYYGGGGAGYAPRPSSATADPTNGAGGLGGGASGLGGKGADGFGGGGSGGGAGGSGVVIVRYRYESNSPFVMVVR